MGKTGIVYVIIGIVALIGAAVAAYLIVTMVSALSIITSADASQFPGTDIATLQESVAYLNMLIILGSVWVLSVFLSGIISIHTGIRSLRKPKTRTLNR